MKKYIAGLFIGFALFGGISVHGEGSPHQFSGNVSLNSDYLYRGISQTSEKMALQVDSITPIRQQVYMLVPGHQMWISLRVWR